MTSTLSPECPELSSRELQNPGQTPNVSIVPYSPCYQPFFRELSESWIKEHWTMEKTDYYALDNPQEHILDRGGSIFVALCGGEPAGVCALLPSSDPAYDYELSKLAVDRRFRGYGIGKKLCETVIEHARSQGGLSIFLESNTLLAPALRLYRALGFCEVKHFHSIYARANVRMQLHL